MLELPMNLEYSRQGLMPPEGDCDFMESQKTKKIKLPVQFHSHCNIVQNCGHRGGLSLTIEEIHGVRLNPPLTITEE